MVSTKTNETADQMKQEDVPVCRKTSVDSSKALSLFVNNENENVEKLNLLSLSGEETQEYLEQLLKDKNELENLNSNNALKHVNKLIDREISNVLTKMSSHTIGGKVSLTETIAVPVDKYPKYNFVGRILGPRGMTAKQLEEETGCKIMVRGRGSSRMNRRDPGNDDMPLHVVIQCEDYKVQAQEKMKNAVDAINHLLNPPPEGKDELKRKQLIELSIINGTYRPTSATRVALQSPKPSTTSFGSTSSDSNQLSDSARILSSLVDPVKSVHGTTPRKTHGREEVPQLFQHPQQFASLSQLLSMLTPVQQPPTQSIPGDYYRNMLSYSMNDPALISAFMNSNQSMDFNNVVPMLPQNNTIPQANLQQYLQAAAMLHSVPFIHDGSGDCQKSKR